MSAQMKCLIVLLIAVAVLLSVVTTSIEARSSEVKCRYAISKARRVIRAIVKHRKRIKKSSGRKRSFHTRALQAYWNILRKLKLHNKDCFKCLKLCRDIKHKFALLKRLLKWVRREKKQLDSFSSKYAGSSKTGKRFKSALQVQHDYLLKKAIIYKAKLGKCKSKCRRRD